MVPSIEIGTMITAVQDVVTSNWAALAGLFGFFWGVKKLPQLVKRFARG